VALRDSLWPHASDVVWSRQTGKGFTSIPRVLPLVMHLIGKLAEKGDPSRVYLDLWARAFDEGLVTVSDENGFAFSSGYTGPRAVRTWREHVQMLEKLGFLWTKEQGNRDIAQILLLNPYKICVKLHEEGKVPKVWWNAFITRANEIGAEIPSAPALPAPSTSSPRPSAQSPINASVHAAGGDVGQDGGAGAK
jgi:hypothetical protein